MPKKNVSIDKSLSPEAPKAKTLVFCDLHHLLVYIRKKPGHSSDIKLRTHSGGLKLKFFLTLRHSLIEVLKLLNQFFRLVLYTPIDDVMSDVVVDYLE